MDMGTSSDDPAITNLSISDPRCINESCIAFLDAENLSQAIIPWASLFRYGHWTTYYYLAIIFLLAVLHFTRTLRDRRRPVTAPSTSSTIFQKLQAAGRYIAYRHVTYKKLRWMGLPSGGMLTFLLSTVLFVVLLAFAKRPWYRAHLGYGSPPLAIRSGLMAFACTPILIALAGKANIVTLLTGISHERLNVVHQWVAWMSFGLSLAHALPFFIQSYREGPFYSISGHDNFVRQFYMGGNTEADEYTGAPPLAILFALCLLSLPPFRKRFYESFYFVHILLAITYLGTLFWHSWNTLDSWSYLWATLALWLASYFARTFYYTQPLSLKNTPMFTSSPTTLTKLPGGMTRIEVLAPSRFQFTAAQHCFLRFPSISLLDNHPFTIASAPAPPSKTSQIHENSQSLIFYVRSHTGFTQKLEAYCSAQPDNMVSSWIDGPYGGINRPIELLYDTLIFVAGGTGISACLPWILYVVNLTSSSPDYNVRVKRVILHWAIKDQEHIGWVSKQLEELTSQKENRLSVELKFYVTGAMKQKQATTISRDRNVDVEKGGDMVEVAPSPSPPPPARSVEDCGYHSGRPVLSTVVSDSLSLGKNMVFGCGPDSLRGELGNAVAGLQSEVLKGAYEEVALHLEYFGW